MQQARMLGCRVEKISASCNVSPLDLSKVIGCSEIQIKSFFKGRAYISFDQLSKLADHLKIEISDLFCMNESDYNKAVVHCMNEFDHPDNRETILDIIDEYMDVLDSVSN